MREVALELARHAAAKGVRAVSSLPPGGGLSYQEIRGWCCTSTRRSRQGCAEQV